MKNRIFPLWRKIKSGHIVVFLYGVFFSILIAFLYIYQPKFFKIIEHKIYDTLLRRIHTADNSGVPVIVDLDEKSLAKFGQWPWPRYRVALLLSKIRQAGALSVGMDILFAEPDRTSPQVLQFQLKRDLKVNMDFKGLPAALMDNDQVLADVLAGGPYILGYSFDFKKTDRPETACTLHPLNISIVKEPGVYQDKNFTFNAPDVFCPLKILGDSARASGFFDIQPDVDGISRRTPLLISYKGRYYPSLSLASLMQATGIKQAVLKVTPAGAKAIKIGDTVVPVDERAQMLVKFRGGARTFRYISAADILVDRFEKKILKNKIVLIGTSAAGLLDIRATPLDEVYPGVEVHATAIDNMLKQDILFRPDWAPGLELGLIILTGLVSTLLLVWATAALSLFPLVAIAVGIWQGFFHQDLR